MKIAGVTTHEALRQLLLERSPQCVASAQNALRAYQAHGYISWYPWSIKNWGTKWNAYGLRILEHATDRLVFSFDTAWSPPTPIFDALAERDDIKTLEFDIAAFDEAWNFGYVGTISDGYHLGEIVEVTPDLYDAVCGVLPDA